MSTTTERPIETVQRGLENLSRFERGKLTGKMLQPPYRYMDAGQLSREWTNKLASQITRRATYLVYSYDTVIAWHQTGLGWVVPDEYYSSTTSRHQGLVKRALSNLGVTSFVTSI